MGKKPKSLSKKNQELLQQRLKPVYRRVGTITFFVGLAAILAGLWVDRMTNNQPIFTIAFTVITFPLILLLNTSIIRKSILKIQEEISKK